MNKFAYKLATSIATASLLASALSPLALATTDPGVSSTISGNGADTTNTTNVSVTNVTTITQSNQANIQNNVSTSSNTGGNDANKNTGGSVTIDTGDASSGVGIQNTANQNIANVSGCCPKDASLTISNNGADSTNKAGLTLTNATNLTQYNNADVKNKVYADVNSGYNDANKNTNGDVSVTTGDASSIVDLKNKVNKNVANVGSGSNGNGSLSVLINGNGADSTNNAAVVVASVTDLTQQNYADLSNRVRVDVNSGNNDANKNTGGSVGIDTGDADSWVGVRNDANFNWASVDPCGCILSDDVKISGNGAYSNNTALVALTSVQLISQWNDFACGGKNPEIQLEEILRHHRHGNYCADVNSDANTGNNDANKNTGESDDPAVTTGDSDSTVVVSNTANNNSIGTSLDLSNLTLPGFSFSGGNVSGLVAFLFGLFS